MASIQLRARGEFAPSPATPLAICERVSPRCTSVSALLVARGLAAAAGSAAGARGWHAPEAALPVAVAGAAAVAGASAGAGAGGGAGSVARAIDPSRAPGPVAAGATGALATADSPGV